MTSAPQLGAKQGAPVDQPRRDLRCEVGLAQFLRLPYGRKAAYNERLRGPEKMNAWNRGETSLLLEVERTDCAFLVVGVRRVGP